MYVSLCGYLSNGTILTEGRKISRFDLQPMGDLICLLLGTTIFYLASARYRSTM